MTVTLGYQGDRWPGMTKCFDARCHSCSWGFRDGIYQVMQRDYACLVHGGPLDAAMRRESDWTRVVGTINSAVVQVRNW